MSQPLSDVDDFDHLDIDWLMHDDNLVRRYYVHIQPLGGDHLQHASDMIVKSLKWRKETGIRCEQMRNIFCLCGFSQALRSIRIQFEVVEGHPRIRICLVECVL